MEQSFPDYFYKENIAKDKKVIPDPIDDRKFQENFQPLSTNNWKCMEKTHLLDPTYD